MIVEQAKYYIISNIFLYAWFFFRVTVVARESCHDCQGSIVQANIKRNGRPKPIGMRWGSRQVNRSRCGRRAQRPKVPKIKVERRRRPCRQNNSLETVASRRRILFTLNWMTMWRYAHVSCLASYLATFLSSDSWIKNHGLKGITLSCLDTRAILRHRCIALLRE